jgi:hypothetical protein
VVLHVVLSRKTRNVLSNCPLAARLLDRIPSIAIDLDRNIAHSRIEREGHVPGLDDLTDRSLSLGLRVNSVTKGKGGAYYVSC